MSHSNKTKKDSKNRKVYLVGGGIASLAAAFFLIKDGHIPGENIHIFEELNMIGGSCDAVGSPEKGYVMRGGRMMNEETFECTWELLKSIPSLTDPKKSVKEEIHEFNNIIEMHSKARLIDGHGKIVDVSSMKFSNKDRLAIAKLIITSEEALGTLTIRDWFSQSFFNTTFWYMWATTFAFQPWNSAVELKRYMIRFIHEYPRINTLEGIMHTPYNQYESLILPILKWLEPHGVNFHMNSKVTDLDFKPIHGEKTVECIHYTSNGEEKKIILNDNDLVFVTNGSITEGSAIGSMTEPPVLGSKGSSFKLWQNIVGKQPGLGKPSTFTDYIDKSLWESFTVTCKEPLFFNKMEKLTGNKPGTGGLVTFMDSNWLMSVVCSHQPHFIHQPENINIFWGYALFPNKVGNCVKKKMSECSGKEILTEICYHLKFTDVLPKLLESSNCIPCMMPFITSQFLPRAKGDRPKVVPEESTNLAFLGQYCEIPDDVVFTLEYSVRSAQIAVYSLLNIDKKIPRINRYQYDIGVLVKSLITSFK